MTEKEVDMSKKEKDISMARAITNTYSYAQNNVGSGIDNIDRILKSSSRRRTQSRENIRKALKNPTSEANIQILQSAMESYRISNGLLKQFINYQSNILTNDHFIVPLDMTKFKSKEDMWKKETEVARYIDLFNIKKNFKWMFDELITFGELYIYVYESKDNVMIYKLPPDVCKVKKKDSNMLSKFVIDLSKISSDVLGYYPKEIQDIWNKKQNKTLKDDELIDGKFYLVGDCGTAFILDEWGNKGTPYFSHILDALMTLENVEDIDTNNAITDNFKLIQQLIPIDDKTGECLIDFDAVSIYHNSVKNSVPKGIGVVTSPMKIDGVALGDSKIKNLDYVTKIKKNIYDVAGFNDDLFNGSKSSNEAIAMGAVVDTLLPLKIQSMFSNWLNAILKNNSKTKNWKIVFCNSTEYNQLNMVKNERENLAVYGSKKKYLALQGYTPLEALNIILNEEMLGIEEKMLPMQTSHTLSGNDEKGRPSNADNPDSLTTTGESESE